MTSSDRMIYEDPKEIVFHVVSQNVDGDGPAPHGDFVLTQESRRDFVERDGYRVGETGNPQLQTAWKPEGYGYQPDLHRSVFLHGSGVTFGLKNFGPRRTAEAYKFHPPSQHKFAVVDTHWVNRSTRNWALRKRLRARSFAIVSALVEELHEEGYIVILCGDFNIGSRSWKGFREQGMVDVFGKGQGRIFVTRHPRITVEEKWHGPKVGDGHGVEHVSDHIRVTLR